MHDRCEVRDFHGCMGPGLSVPVKFNLDINPRKVLFVTYLFPPAGSVGVHRTLRFVKWLPSYGWQPIILTASNAKVAQLEPRLKEKVSDDLQVCRSYSLEALNYGKSILATDYQKDTGHNLVAKICQLPKDLWAYCAIPDTKLGWVPFAIAMGADIIRQQRIDAIYVTGKPFSSYWIGHQLSRRFGIPWVMDVRDLWVLNRRSIARSPVHASIESWMERKLVRSAAAIVANTPNNRADFIERYPECDPEKFVTITNGFDEEDFSPLNGNKYDKFTIAYTGSFYFALEGGYGIYRRLLGFNKKRSEIVDTHSPKYLFEALARILQERPEMRTRIEVVIAGSACTKIGSMVSHYGLDRVVRCLGWLSHSESMRLIQRSHVACVVLARGKESEGWVPAKLYQYLGAGTPVLALVPEGDAATIVRDIGMGEVVPPDDIAQIRNAMLCMYDAIQGTDKVRAVYSPVRERVMQFEGRALTARLARTLERMTGIDREHSGPQAVGDTSPIDSLEAVFQLPVLR
jgi:glycosyltransferase involved in cell wall biosynthesis